MNNKKDYLIELIYKKLKDNQGRRFYSKKEDLTKFINILLKNN